MAAAAPSRAMGRPRARRARPMVVAERPARAGSGHLPAPAEAPAGLDPPAGDAAAALGLLPLLAWLSPAFPVGAYAYSHALEWAVEAGDIATAEDLARWIEDLFRHGFARTDAIVLSAAHGAVLGAVRGAVDAAARSAVQVGASDAPLPVSAAAAGAALEEINALAVALAPSAELRLETCQQGRSFLDAVAAAWPAPLLGELAPRLKGEVAYPVAVGLAAAAHHVPLVPTLEAFLLALAQNLVSAGLRLAPIGQTAGTKVVAALAPLARTLAAEAPGLTLDDIGSATFRADLASFRHETQYTRLFRS